MQLLDVLNYLNHRVVTKSFRLFLYQQKQNIIFIDSNDPAKDLSHILDFLCHVKYVQVCCQTLGNKGARVGQTYLIIWRFV